MHCDLRQPDAAPVLIRFNYDNHAKFEVAQPLASYSVFTADTLRYAVTLNFDPVTLTFDREHAQYTGFATVKLCTKFERNQIIRGGVITI